MRLSKGNPEISRRDNWEAGLKELNDKIELFEAENAKRSPPVRALEAKEFYEALKLNRKYRGLAAFLVNQNLYNETISWMFSVNEADFVLAGMEHMKHLTLPDMVIPPAVQSFAASIYVPKLEKPKLEMVEGKPAETELFRVKTRPGRGGKLVPVGGNPKGDIQFETLSRRFHGIWDGIPLKECISGSCKHIKDITQSRWAVTAIADSKRYHLHKNGSYSGFVQLTPITVKGNTYGSVDFGAEILGLQMKVEDPLTHKQIMVPVFESWLREQEIRWPAHWKGIVVSESNAINNARVLNPMRENPIYLLADEAVPSAEAVILDPMAKAIVDGREYKPSGELLDFGARGQMIFDAMAPDAGKLRVLDSSLAVNPIAVQKKIDRILSTPSDHNFIGALTLSGNLDPNAEWSQEFWAKIPNYLAHADEASVVEIVRALSHRKNWSAPVWRAIFQLLERDSEAVHAITLKLIKDLERIPTEQLENFSIAMLYSKGGGKSPLAQEAFRSKGEWSRDFWQRLYRLLVSKDTGVHRSILKFLSFQRNWPAEIWKEIPELIRTELTTSDLGASMALLSQRTWPDYILGDLAKAFSENHRLGQFIMEEMGSNPPLIQGVMPEAFRAVLPKDLLAEIRALHPVDKSCETWFLFSPH